ncbi:MAG TPA: sigma-70 family RNA polymerase sigma factor [Gemmataceae bacterium]
MSARSGHWRLGSQGGGPLQENNRRARFEQVMMPHLAAAYNLARWLTRNDHDAEDLVQEAYLRAYKFFNRFQGDDGRAWLLAVVRNTCYTWLKQHHARELAASFDETVHGAASDALNPEKLLLQKATQQMLREALEELPIAFREVVVLRDLEGFSYKEIASIVDVPLGTVMSRLTRGRGRLQQCLGPRLSEELEK